MASARLNIGDASRNKGTVWLLSALLLSLPSLIFVILHAFYGPATLPEFFDLVVVWTMTGTIHYVIVP